MYNPYVNPMLPLCITQMQIRNNNTLSRDHLIEPLVQSVLTMCRENKVDLDSPAYTLNVDVIRKVCCVGVLRGDVDNYRRYNLEAVQAGAVGAHVMATVEGVDVVGAVGREDTKVGGAVAEDKDASSAEVEKTNDVVEVCAMPTTLEDNNKTQATDVEESSRDDLETTDIHKKTSPIEQLNQKTSVDDVCQDDKLNGASLDGSDRTASGAGDSVC